MKIHYIQHAHFEDLSNIKKWAVKKNHNLEGTLIYQDNFLPKPEDFDLLVVLGGPMNIYEENQYSWLVEEKKLIEKTINQNKHVLGICLGAQLIADVLGAKVYKNRFIEIGWFPVGFHPDSLKTPFFKDFPEQFTPFHWHGDTFDMPEGAIRLASSEACLNQGFVYENKTIGLQFHMEFTKENILKLVENCPQDIKTAEFIQKPDYIISQEQNFQKLEPYLFNFLDNLEKEITKEIKFLKN